ncbi:MAG TPA: hypothetical protein VEA44_06510 [Caulobacter sp.]|nr:hypothetical protein [Caulobacter sp.]
MAKTPEVVAPPEPPYVDRPDLAETFADKARRMTFDGRTLRIEFCVERPDDSAGKRATPVCRLVLDLDGAVDLFNKINTLQAAMESRGVIRRDAA